MTSTAEDLLDNYNPLYDVHLRQYFALPHMQKHLRYIGLANGTTDNEAQKQHHAMIDVVLRNREAQLMKLAEIQKKLDVAEKVEICRRIRNGMSSPLSGRKGKPSRSLSRGRNGDNRRSRRSSASTDEKEFIKKIEVENEEAPPSNPTYVYNRLSAAVLKYRYLHKLDDQTLAEYMEHLRRQLNRLERFREVSFGPHSIARHQGAQNVSWFFRRRSLPSLTDPAHINAQHEALRSSQNVKDRSRAAEKAILPKQLNDSHDSRSTYPLTKKERRNSESNRLPAIAISKKTKSSTKSIPRLPPSNKLEPIKTQADRSRSRKRDQPVRIRKVQSDNKDTASPQAVISDKNMRVEGISVPPLESKILSAIQTTTPIINGESAGEKPTETSAAQIQEKTKDVASDERDDYKILFYNDRELIDSQSTTNEQKISLNDKSDQQERNEAALPIIEKEYTDETKSNIPDSDQFNERYKTSTIDDKNPFIEQEVLSEKNVDVSQAIAPEIEKPIVEDSEEVVSVQGTEDSKETAKTTFERSDSEEDSPDESKLSFSTQETIKQNDFGDILSLDSNVTLDDNQSTVIPIKNIFDSKNDEAMDKFDRDLTEAPQASIMVEPSETEDKHKSEAETIDLHAARPEIKNLAPKIEEVDQTCETISITKEPYDTNGKETVDENFENQDDKVSLSSRKSDLLISFGDNMNEKEKEVNDRLEPIEADSQFDTAFGKDDTIIVSINANDHRNEEEITSRFDDSDIISIKTRTLDDTTEELRSLNEVSEPLEVLDSTQANPTTFKQDDTQEDEVKSTVSSTIDLIQKEVQSEGDQREISNQKTLISYVISDSSPSQEVVPVSPTGTADKAGGELHESSKELGKERTEECKYGLLQENLIKEEDSNVVDSGTVQANLDHQGPNIRDIHNNLSSESESSLNRLQLSEPNTIGSNLTEDLLEAANYERELSDETTEEMDNNGNMQIDKTATSRTASENDENHGHNDEHNKNSNDVLKSS